MNHTCPFDGCTREVPMRYFACIDHWNSLSKYQKEEVEAAYGLWRAGEISAEELRARQKGVLDEVQQPNRRKGKS